MKMKLIELQDIKVLGIKNKKTEMFLKTSNFKEAVEILQRPYYMISENDNNVLLSNDFDFFFFTDKIVTFGSADGGFALMPLTDKAVKDLGFDIAQIKNTIKLDNIDFKNELEKIDNKKLEKLNSDVFLKHDFYCEKLTSGFQLLTTQSSGIVCDILRFENFDEIQKLENSRINSIILQSISNNTTYIHDDEIDETFNIIKKIAENFKELQKALKVA